MKIKWKAMKWNEIEWEWAEGKHYPNKGIFKRKSCKTERKMNEKQSALNAIKTNIIERK